MLLIMKTIEYANGIKMELQYIVDAANHRISKWDTDANFIGWIGGGSNGWKTTNGASPGNGLKSFNGPRDVTVDKDGNLYIADYNNARICKWDKNGNAIGWIGGGSNGWKTNSGTELNYDYQSFYYPTGVTVDSEGNIYVCDNENNRVCKWDKNGNVIGWIGNGSNGWKISSYTENIANTDYQSFAHPMDICLDVLGNLYITDNSNHRVSKWSQE